LDKVELNSNFGYGFQYGCPTTLLLCGAPITFGLNTDRLVTGDFDGDLRSDIAVFRPADGTWYYLRSTSTVGNAPDAFSGFAWGLTGDIPQPADYDGDKRTDFAVFRPSNGTRGISRTATTARITPTARRFGAARPTDRRLRLTGKPTRKGRCETKNEKA
jgi:hypothetical protein